MVDPQFFFIQKPFSAAGLGNKLRQVLSEEGGYPALA
jgi:hypothetical protein